MSRTATEDFPRNLSSLDRRIRLVTGGVLLLLAATGALHGVAAVAAWLFAWVPLVTGAAGWCPVYTLFGIRTRER